MRVSLTVAYNDCTDPNETHGPPLAFGSCSPPTQSSDYLTVGTPDANGQPAKSIGFLRFGTHIGDPSTATDEADVRLDASVTDVRCRIAFFPCAGGALSDYTGVLDAKFDLRITDRYNGGSGEEAGTLEVPAFRLPFHLVVPCSPTAAADVGSTCAVSTTVDTLVPGTVREGKRAVWEIGQVQVKDGGADGATLDDNTLFLDQGLFVP
jgi:hypothetical protein